MYIFRLLCLVCRTAEYSQLLLEPLYSEHMKWVMMQNNTRQPKLAQSCRGNTEQQGNKTTGEMSMRGKWCKQEKENRYYNYAHKIKKFWINHHYLEKNFGRCHEFDSLWWSKDRQKMEGKELRKNTAVSQTESEHTLVFWMLFWTPKGFLIWHHIAISYAF